MFGCAFTRSEECDAAGGQTLPSLRLHWRPDGGTHTRYQLERDADGGLTVPGFGLHWRPDGGTHTRYQKERTLSEDWQYLVFSSTDDQTEDPHMLPVRAWRYRRSDGTWFPAPLTTRRRDPHMLPRHTCEVYRRLFLLNFLLFVELPRIIIYNTIFVSLF